MQPGYSMDESFKLHHDAIQPFLRQYFLAHPLLAEKCRELSYNFEKVFTTLELLSPAIEEEGKQMEFSFDCLTMVLAVNEKFDEYPVYAIELSRFFKALSAVGCKLS